MMENFPEESGLDLAGKSLAWCSPVRPAWDGMVLPALASLLGRDRPLGVARGTNKGQPDLAYLETVLVSTGWNLNDDVFWPSEVWAARRSPEDKPFNYEHVQDDIIGHITSNRVVDETSLSIPEDTAVEDLPSRFHVLTGAVLYRFWEKEEAQKRMDDILAGIARGEWFVSMECLFGQFDYALLSPAGEQKVVARNKSTAFLTRHLRAYGGDGSYQGYRVGRLLREIVFSGKGLVRQPANPDSVILKADRGKAVLVYDEFVTERETMSDTEKKVAELEAELARAKAELTSARESVSKLEANLQTSQATVTKLTEAHEQDVKTIETLTASVAALTSEKKKSVRVQHVMAKLGVDDKAAAALVEPSLAASDEIFTGYVEALASLKKPVGAGVLENVRPAAEATLSVTDSDEGVDELFREVASHFGVEDEGE